MSAQQPNLTPILGFATSVWNPTSQTISNITQSDPCVITTTNNFNFEEGIYVRIFLPSSEFGMRELNGKIFPATILSPNTFSIPVDSRGFAPFAPVIGQTAQVLPSGQGSLTLANTITNITTVPPNAPLG
jgi:hypothetical protein